MRGTIIGDIVGSIFEFDNYKAIDFTPFFNPDAFFTDDTICTIAIADSLLNNREPAVALHDWCNRYIDVGGFGNRFSIWLASDDPKPYGSTGNGSAMRISPVGLLASSLDEVATLTKMVTEVTHNTAPAITGATATASAIYLARTGASKDEIAAYVTTVFGYDLSRSIEEIRATYTYSELAENTCPEAICCALQAHSFEEAIRNAISIGGDSDTIAAIVGGIAEALYGIPEGIQEQGISYLPEDMKKIVHLLYGNAYNRDLLVAAV